MGLRVDEGRGYSEGPPRDRIQRDLPLDRDPDRHPHHRHGLFWPSRCQVLRLKGKWSRFTSEDKASLSLLSSICLFIYHVTLKENNSIIPWSKYSKREDEMYTSKLNYCLEK